MNEYAQLINRVAKVNHQAALWMTRKLPLYAKRNKDINLHPTTTMDLSCAFVWDETPQGRSYWHSIHYVLTRRGFL